jgi:hypothetical protein
MRSEYIDHLRGEVEEHFGRKILTSADCNQLAVEIQAKTAVKMNTNTLRRCFQLVKSDYLPSFNTLNILSQYCGFVSFDDFVKHEEKKTKKRAKSKDHGLLRYLTSIFKNLEVQDLNDLTFLNFVRQTINFFRKEPAIVEDFQKAIAHTKNGQTFYFEQFVNIDQLNGYYGDGLRYYLAEKKTKSAQIFGHALLAFRYWLVIEPDACNRHCEQVLQYTVNNTIHPFVCGRYFATKLYHAQLNGLDPGPVLHEAREFFTHIRPARDNYRFFPCFELILSEALLLAGKPAEALYYLQGCRHEPPQPTPYIDVYLFNAFELYEAAALFQLEHYKEAEELYRKIRPENFYFLSKKYHTILYLQLRDSLHGRKTNTGHTGLLIQETGFKRLEDFFPDSFLTSCKDEHSSAITEQKRTH